jgi:hypothetical protein
MPQPAHAELGQHEPGRKTPPGVHSRIDDARASLKCVHADLQLVGARHARFRDFPGTFVEIKMPHHDQIFGLGSRALEPVP